MKTEKNCQNNISADLLVRKVEGFGKSVKGGVKDRTESGASTVSAS